jgi:hypothetical protein
MFRVVSKLRQLTDLIMIGDPYHNPHFYLQNGTLIGRFKEELKARIVALFGKLKSC